MNKSRIDRDYPWFDIWRLSDFVKQDKSIVIATLKQFGYLLHIGKIPTQKALDDGICSITEGKSQGGNDKTIIRWHAVKYAHLYAKASGLEIG